jgi:hypothetical protein
MGLRPTQGDEKAKVQPPPSMQSPPSPLSSRLPRRAVGAKPRDLRFRGPFLEMFSTHRTRISCHPPLKTTAFAAFGKESRMKLDNAT